MWLCFVKVYPRLETVRGDIDTRTFVGGWVDFWETRHSEPIREPLVSTQPVATKLHDGETRHPRSG